MSKKIDLSDMNSRFSEQTYESTYAKYMNFFHWAATEPSHENVIIYNCPPAWVPFLHCLGFYIESTQKYFDIDNYIDVSIFVQKAELFKKEVYDVHVQYRPETVDAIWKVYNQDDWQGERICYLQENESFTITTNINFYRKDINNFINRSLHNYKPDKENVVLVPCAADKPYPAPLHKAVLEIMPENFYLANATGVLGIVPQDLWGIMPNYDSGIPNEWRLFNIAIDYFKRNEHKKIIVYLDFYSLSLYYAFSHLNILDKVIFVNPVKYYCDYLDLLDKDKLELLKSTFEDKVIL